jgi:hypothetical protein
MPNSWPGEILSRPDFLVEIGPPLLLETVEGEESSIRQAHAGEVESQTWPKKSFVIRHSHFVIPPS